MWGADKNRIFGRITVLLIFAAAIGMAGPGDGQADWLIISNDVYSTYYLDSEATPKFRYSQASTRWEHYSQIDSGWYALSAPGMSSTFVGNGSWHDLGTGLKYRYDLANDYGFYTRGSAYRFYYRYLAGQWYTSGYGGGWYGLGSSGTNAGMLGAGYTNLNNGLKYQYNGTYDFGFYQREGAYRFYYRYSPGQWYTSGYGGGWHILGTSGRNAGLLGTGWTDVGNGLSYRYNGLNDFGYYGRGGAYRFYYRYGQGQWYQSGYGGGWYVLGASGLTANQIISGTYAYVGGNFNWQYRYAAGEDKGYWVDAYNHQFAYTYSDGQWWDYLSSVWARLGLDGTRAQFIGDGGDREFSPSDYFRYAGSNYYWRTGAVDYYRYEYGTGTWWTYQTDGTWEAFVAPAYEADVRYIGDHKYVTRWRHPDYGSYAPGDAYDIDYTVWLAGTASFARDELAAWTIHRPGTDNKWSGGLLNVVWLHEPEFMIGLAEYTIEDVVVMKYNLETTGLSAMVDMLSYVRDYFRQSISTVAISAHGNSTGWYIGQWIGTWNYFVYQTVFERWGSYMTADGQIMGYHCEVGQAAEMLDQIAEWTGTEVYAHNHLVWMHWTPINWDAPPDQYRDDSMWNHNYSNVKLRKDEAGTLDSFEYKSNPSIDARILFEEREW